MKYVKCLSILFGLFVLLTGICLLSLSINQIKEINSLTNVDSFNKINKDGSFVIYSDDNKTLKIKKDFTTENNKIRQFNWYTDFACGDCINLHMKL